MASALSPRRGLGMIWAQSTDGIIGDGRDMPWHLPEDLRHFKDVTRGHTVVMGRRTWESLPESFRPLPGRTNLVLTSRNPGSWSRGATLIHDVADPDDETWVIGGGAVYEALLERARILWITEVDVALGGRPSPTGTWVHAPRVPAGFSLRSASGWQVSENGRILHSDGSATVTPPRYRFLCYERDAATD